MQVGQLAWDRSVAHANLLFETSSTLHGGSLGYFPEYGTIQCHQVKEVTVVQDVKRGLQQTSIFK
jgi:hypothetical protein